MIRGAVCQIPVSDPSMQRTSADCVWTVQLLAKLAYQLQCHLDPFPACSVIDDAGTHDFLPIEFGTGHQRPPITG